MTCLSSFCVIDWNEMLWSAAMPPMHAAGVLLREEALGDDDVTGRR